ncbi:MAG: IS1595 family transposase [Rhodopila sp.]
MNILDLFQSFQTDEQALEHLEQTRWRGRPLCPYCGGEHVGRHVSGDRKRQRWQCRDCKRAFAVTVGTMFHGTHIPLRSWFLVLALMLNAKKSASSCQIARDIGIRQPTVWSMMHRIRAVMEGDMEQAGLLHGIVEADETYVGGKPRKGNKHGEDDQKSKAKRGRGTNKTPVVGVVERGGRVAAKPVGKADVAGKGLSKFIKRFVDTAASLLITDEFSGYNKIGAEMRHATVNHAIQYADGGTHTNTIEGFWALVKRAWYGQHHHYSLKYTHLYIAEACFKYNIRKMAEPLGPTIAMTVGA